MLPLLQVSELSDKAPIVSINIYGSPIVGIIVSSSSCLIVSSTNKNGFSPSKVKYIIREYEAVNIHRNENLKKWSILITPLI